MEVLWGRTRSFGEWDGVHEPSHGPGHDSEGAAATENSNTGWFAGLKLPDLGEHVQRYTEQITRGVSEGVGHVGETLSRLYIPITHSTHSCSFGNVSPFKARASLQCPLTSRPTGRNPDPNDDLVPDAVSSTDSESVAWGDLRHLHEDFASEEQIQELESLQEDVERLKLVLEGYEERVGLAQVESRIADVDSVGKLPVLTCRGRTWTCAHQRDDFVEMDLTSARKGAQRVHIYQCSASGKFLTRMCSVRVLGECETLAVADCSKVLVLVDSCTKMAQIMRCEKITLVFGNVLPDIELVDCKDVNILGCMPNATTHTFQTSKTSEVRMKVLQNEIVDTAPDVLLQSHRMREMFLPDVSIVEAKGHVLETTLGTLHGSSETWTRHVKLTEEFSEVDRHAGVVTRLAQHVRADLTVYSHDAQEDIKNRPAELQRSMTVARAVGGLARGANAGASLVARRAAGKS